MVNDSQLRAVSSEHSRRNFMISSSIGSAALIPSGAPSFAATPAAGEAGEESIGDLNLEIARRRGQLTVSFGVPVTCSCRGETSSPGAQPISH